MSVVQLFEQLLDFEWYSFCSEKEHNLLQCFIYFIMSVKQTVVCKKKYNNLWKKSHQKYIHEEKYWEVLHWFDLYKYIHTYIAIVHIKKISIKQTRSPAWIAAESKALKPLCTDKNSAWGNAQFQHLQETGFALWKLTVKEDYRHS